MVKSLDFALRVWPTLGDRTYLLVGVVAIVLSRLFVIEITPRSADFSDPRIYQATGQVVLAGVNPYKYEDQPQLREELRSRTTATDTDDSFARTIDSWNYYVSSNLPASTALYAAFEYVAQGSRTVWRFLLILGDVAMFLGMLSLFKIVRGDSLDAWSQIAAFFLVIASPSLIVSGTAVPEDKQFQTALMLFAAAFLLSPKPINTARGIAGGLLLGLSVLFKLFGVFLFPMWLTRAITDRPRFALSTIAGGLIPIAASFIMFGPNFLLTMASRGVRDSVEGPEHVSPWTLLPWLAGNYYLAAKVVVAAALCTYLVTLLSKRRIDLLNCCAGFAVVFACVWLDKGAMNRVNIVIIFSMAAMVSVGSKVPAVLSAFTALAAVLGYALGLVLLHAHLEQVDAVLVLLFLVSYVAALSVQNRPDFRESRRA